MLRPEAPQNGPLALGLSPEGIARVVDETGCFFEALQGLIANNRINNTYKLALIIAIADLTLSADPLLIVPGAEFRISYDAITERFLELYWPQTKPFQVEYRQEEDSAPLIEHSAVLVQGNNNRNPIKILQYIQEFQEAHPTATTSTLARREGDFTKLVRKSRQVIVGNPLCFMNGAEFLFHRDDIGGAVVMDGLAALMLRRFHTAVVELAQARWEEQIRRRNDFVFGTSSMTLRTFLFDQHRQEDLSPVREILLETGEARCFYCGASLARGRTHVDHFLPYSIFSLPRIHNFVLACEHCNTSKSNTLAAYDHAEHWVSRNVRLGNDLTAAALAEHFPVDSSGFYGVVRTSYASALLRGEKLWMGGPAAERLVTWPRGDIAKFLSVFDPLFRPNGTALKPSVVR